MLHTLLIVHSVLVLLLIVIVLLQKSGSGALSGLSGGGGGGAIFTAQGGKNFMTRVTAILATLFICSSLGLAILSKKDTDARAAKKSIVDDIIKEEQSKPNTVPSVPLAQ